MTGRDRQQQIEARAQEWLAWRPGRELPAWAAANDKQADVRVVADALAADVLALAARLSGLQDTLAAIYDLCPAAVKRPPLPGPADPPEWEALRKIAALALNTDGPEGQR